jgi:LPXTG-site transpeptidase (sortase) family protein
MADGLGKVLMGGMLILVLSRLLAGGTVLAGIGEQPVTAYAQQARPTQPTAPPPPRRVAPAVALARSPAPVSRPAKRVAAADRHDWLSVPSVNLSVGLTDYRDCTASTLLTRASGARDWCVPADETLLIGHNPGVFTRLVDAKAGAEVNYWDHQGRHTTFRIDTARRLPKGDADAVSQQSSHGRLILITCAVPDGSVVWMFVASPTN